MDDEPGALDKALERAEKAEAEVERLRALLREAQDFVPPTLWDRIDAALGDRHD